MANRFTSFVKTRILCSVPGAIPFDYNEIREFYKCIILWTTLLESRFLGGGDREVAEFISCS